MTTQSIVDILLPRIQKLPPSSRPLVIAIDGRCASGKTTLSAELSACFSCPVIHMDHFFLRPHMRTPERLAHPGGNIDKERFSEEVAPHLKAGLPFSYVPFDCQKQTLGNPINIPASDVILVEGSYALCPELWELYDLRLFLTVSPEKQLERIKIRNGDAGLEAFKHRWIPMEEAYFEAFHISDRCDLVFDTTHI